MIALGDCLLSISGRELVEAHKCLAELKGAVKSMPNESILINTHSLQEAKDSSAVESIITTHDESYKAELFASQYATPASKEVKSYADALRTGFSLVKMNNQLTNNIIIEIYRIVKQNSSEFRTTSGTTFKNEATQENIYTPPQTHDEIAKYMANLEQYINDASIPLYEDRLYLRRGAGIAADGNSLSDAVGESRIYRENQFGTGEFLPQYTTVCY